MKIIFAIYKKVKYTKIVVYMTLIRKVHISDFFTEKTVS